MQGTTLHLGVGKAQRGQPGRTVERLQVGDVLLRGVLHGSSGQDFGLVDNTEPGRESWEEGKRETYTMSRKKRMRWTKSTSFEGKLGRRLFTSSQHTPKDGGGYEPLPYAA